MIQTVNMDFSVNEDEQLVVKRTVTFEGTVVGYDECHLPRAKTQALAAKIIDKAVVNETIDPNMTLHEFAFRQGAFRTVETHDDRTLTSQYIDEEVS